jgi:ubiquinone/menaquinone biosynthesis C-methylase UbiE
MADPAVHHPLFARLYPAMAKAMERGGMAERRRSLLAGLSGPVLEVGAGDGLNLRRYPASVTRVLAVEPEPTLRRRAEAAAVRAPVSVDVADGLAEALPVADMSIKAAVVSLVLCSVADQDAALRELHRVIEPGGQLRFLEHVRAETSGMARVQRALDATIWPHLAGGCHTGRDTVGAIRRAGFEVERLDRFRFPDARTPSSFHVLGTAVRLPGAA